MKKNSWLAVFALAIGELLPNPAHAALTPPVATGWGIDDWNTSTLVPNTVVGGKNTPTIYTANPCPWISTAMTAFANANGYSYQWAAPFANEASDLTVTDYQPWVVNPINTVNGFNLVARPAGRDQGGATFGLTYTPKRGDPTSVLFIQAYQEILYGLNGNANPVVNVKLDNTGTTPQYGGASSYTAAVSKMADRPFDSEIDAAVRNPEGYHTDVQFQTVLAVDNGIVAGKENLTLYQYSEWWGYRYDNTDVAPVPEPSTYVAGALTLTLMSVSVVRRKKQTTEAMSSMID